MRLDFSSNKKKQMVHDHPIWRTLSWTERVYCCTVHQALNLVLCVRANYIPKKEEFLLHGVSHRVMSSVFVLFSQVCRPS